MRRRFASDYNNSARAVRVPRTVAPIQRDRSAYLLVVNTRQGYHLNFFFFMFVERELVVEEEFKYRAYRSRSSLVEALIQADDSYQDIYGVEDYDEYKRAYFKFISFFQTLYVQGRYVQDIYGF